MTKPILVAGIGNIFLGDDGFGVEVANRLIGRVGEKPFPPHVMVADFGIRGLHLAYDMMDNGYGLVILVDTISQGDEPGTITVMEIDPTSDGEQPPDAHDMDPANVLALLADLGGKVDRLLIVGCEPAVLDEGIGLSDRLMAVVDEAVRVVEGLIEEAAELVEEEAADLIEEETAGLIEEEAAELVEEGTSAYAGKES